jgi:hypothetical protein
MSNSDSESDNHLKYQVYLDERNSLIDAKREGTRFFDKAILTLAGGAFGLSLTFIRQSSPNIIPRCKYLLVFAWAGFCISILSTLISFLTSQSACLKQIEILGDEWLAKDDRDKKVNIKNKPAIRTKRLNVISIFAFIIGTICLAWFTIVNL